MRFTKTSGGFRKYSGIRFKPVENPTSRRNSHQKPPEAKERERKRYRRPSGRLVRTDVRTLVGFSVCDFGRSLPLNHLLSHFFISAPGWQVRRLRPRSPPPASPSHELSRLKKSLRFGELSTG